MQRPLHTSNQCLIYKYRDREATKLSPKMQLIENYIDEELWLIVLCPYLNEENTVPSDSCTGYHECSFYSLVL